MKKFVTMLLLTCGFCAAASADVYKCKNPDGKTVYADEPCGRHATRLSNLDANTLPAIAVPITATPPSAPVAQVQKPFEPATASHTPAFVPNATECERERRNADTMASSFTADPKRVELAERHVNMVCFGSAKAAEIEQARAAAPRVVIHHTTRPVVRAPRNISYCMGTYCYDDLGGRHPRPTP